jgi:hypothetical protein
MLERIPPLTTGDIDSTAAARPVSPTGASGAPFRLASPEQAAAGPPPEVLGALDTVQEAQQELQARGLRVSFDVTPSGVRVSLLDSSGALVKEFSPAEALDALSGETPIEGLDR